MTDREDFFTDPAGWGMISGIGMGGVSMLGISTACFYGDGTVEEGVDRLAKMGIRQIEIYLNTFSEYKEAYVRDLRKRLNDHGMVLYSLHPNGVQYEHQMFGVYQRAVEDSFDIFKRAMDAAAILGAKVTIMHGGVFFKPARRENPPYHRIAPVLDRACDICRERGLLLAHENVHWCWFNKPEFATQVLSMTQHPQLAFNMDLKQAVQSGYEAADYLAVMGDRTRNIHLCDYIKEDGYVTPLLPGEGQADFVGLRDTLLAMGYDRPMMLEVYRGNFKDLAQLKDCYDRMNEIFAPLWKGKRETDS